MALMPASRSPVDEQPLKNTAPVGNRRVEIHQQLRRAGHQLQTACLQLALRGGLELLRSVPKGLINAKLWYWEKLA